MRTSNKSGWACLIRGLSKMATTSSSVLSFLLVILQLLLICSGDVEVNPGPLDQGECAAL